MATTSRVRVCVRANHNQRIEAVLVLKGETPAARWQELLHGTKSKLRFSGARWFDAATGQELSQGSNDAALVNGAVLIVSRGEDLVGCAPRQPRAQVPVVGAPDAPVCSSPHIEVLANEAWLEDGAVAQLRQVTRDLPCVTMAFGMPDLHAGRRYPVGAVFVSEGVLFPALVGNDIGCGMRLCRTSIAAASSSPKSIERWAQQLGSLDDAMGQPPEPRDAWAAAFPDACGIDLQSFQASLGTIGGGNHFAELQRVEEVYLDRGVDETALYLLVHSGSRGLGAAILDRHIERHGDAGLHSSSPEAAEYLRMHAAACEWARLNRELIAERFVSALGATQASPPVLDIWHNTVAECPCGGASAGGSEGEQVPCGGSTSVAEGSTWVHRKGAAPSDEGLVVIPGSRGTYSYLVEPLEPSMRSGRSLAHGAGRKWARSKALACVAARYPNANALKTTALSGQVVCDNRDLLYEEAPEAYKNVEAVVQDLLAAGLIRLVAKLRPLLCYKTRTS